MSTSAGNELALDVAVAIEYHPCSPQQMGCTNACVHVGFASGVKLLVLRREKIDADCVTSITSVYQGPDDLDFHISHGKHLLQDYCTPLSCIDTEGRDFEVVLILGYTSVYSQGRIWDLAAALML